MSPLPSAATLICALSLGTKDGPIRKETARVAESPPPPMDEWRGVEQWLCKLERLSEAQSEIERGLAHSVIKDARLRGTLRCSA